MTAKYWIWISLNTSKKSSEWTAWQIGDIGSPTEERPLTYHDEKIVQSGETWNNITSYNGIFTKRDDAIAALKSFLPADVFAKWLARQ